MSSHSDIHFGYLINKPDLPSCELLDERNANKESGTNPDDDDAACYYITSDNLLECIITIVHLPCNLINELFRMRAPVIAKIHVYRT